jgi:hypothetical protein
MAAMLVAFAAPALADNDRNDNDRNHHRWFDNNNRDHDDWNDHRDNLIFVYDDDNDFDYDFDDYDFDDYDFDDDDYPYYLGYYPYWGWGGGCEGPVCLID